MVAILLFALAVGAGGNPFLALLLVVPMSLVVLLRVRAAHADDPALGRRLHARQPRHPSRDRLGLGLLHDDGGPALERVLRPGGDDCRHRPAVRRGRPDRRLARARAVGAGCEHEQGLADLLRPRNVRLRRRSSSCGAGARCSASRTSSSGWSPRRSASCTLVTLFQSKATLREQVQRLRAGLHRQRPTPTPARSRRRAKAGVAVDPAFSFTATIPMVAVFATTAIFSYWSTFVGGELRQASTMQDRAQHGARRHHPADPSSRSARRSSSRRSAATSCAPRTAAGCRPRSPYAGDDVLLPQRHQRRQRRLHVRHLPALHRLLAADHVHLDPAADAGDLRDVVRRRAAEGRHARQPRTAARGWRC